MALLPQSPGKIEAYIVGVPGVYLLIVSSVTSRSGQDVDIGQVPLLCLTSGGGGALHLSVVHAGAGTIENPLVIVPPTNLLRSEYRRRGR